jgi:hypothetical protein
MNRKNKFGFLVTSMVFLGVVWGAWRYAEFRGEQRRLNHERCADEATEMVAEFLRTNREALAEIRGGKSEIRNKGDFVRVSGSGYTTPGPWNLEGGFYLSLHRVAQFTGGAEQIQVMVMKGEKKGVFQRGAEDSVIYVTEPELWGD